MIGQSAIVAYCASKVMEISHVLRIILYKSNRPQVSVLWRHDKPLGMLEEQSPAARDLQFFLCSSNIPRGLSAYKQKKLVGSIA